MAGKLFDALMGYVKDNSLKIIPSCSYIEKEVDKLPNSSDFYINRAKRILYAKKLIFMLKNNNIFLQLGKILYIILFL